MSRRKENPVERIREAMKAARIRTPAELARRLGLPRQTVHRWLTDGIDNINYRNLLNLSDALNVNARWLVFGEAGPIKQPFQASHESEASAIARELSNEMRAQWLSIGRTFVALQSKGRKRKRQS